MILAEDFECRIPSGNAVKGDIIYCSAPPTNGWEITGFLVDALVALGTVGSVGIAVWVALDARKRVAEERARADKSERETRIREAAAKVAAAFSTYAEDLETEDQSKFYGISTSIQNLAIAYGEETTERDALCTALDIAVRDLLQPIFVGRMGVAVGARSKKQWDLGIRFWQRKLLFYVSKIQHLFDALNATKVPETRLFLIREFEHEMGLAANSLKASMFNFMQEKI